MNIKLPKGFPLPEGVKGGDDFDALVTVKLSPDAKSVAVLRLDGVDISDAADEEAEDQPEQEENQPTEDQQSPPDNADFMQRLNQIAGAAGPDAGAPQGGAPMGGGLPGM